MKTPQTFAGHRVPLVDRAILAGAWAVGVAYQVVACNSDNAIGPVQGLLLAGLVVALLATAFNLLRASFSAIGCAFTACFCGLLAATLDLPSVPTVASREMALYAFLALVTGAFAIRWDVF